MHRKIPTLQSKCRYNLYLFLDISSVYLTGGISIRVPGDFLYDYSTVTAAATTNYNSASASYSVTVTTGFSWRVTNWGNSYGNRVSLEEPSNGVVSGTTDSDTLYVCTTYADGPGWTAGNCWIELELPPGTYRPRMSHTGQGTYLQATINGSVVSDVDRSFVQADTGTVWMTSFTITSTTKVCFVETNQGGGYSRAQVILCKTS